MRTTQYTFVLVAQVFLLCALFAFGVKIIAPATFPDTVTNVSGDGTQPPAEPGVDNLRQYLSR